MSFSVRKKNIFDPKSEEPFRLSRAKLELFIECPRCFYLDRRLGIGRPEGPPFVLNKTVDTLLKKEFDIHRANGEPHPLMKKYKVDAIPFAHEDMDKWRETFGGIEYLHKPTNFLIFGAVDDIWIDHRGKLIVVDYKATSTSEEINMETGKSHHQAFKREVEIYQWLFRQNNFKVSDNAYFVYVNALKDREAFDGKLEFDVKIIPHKGDCSWVEKKIIEARKCLDSEKIPKASPNCEYCAYRERAGEVGA